MVPAGYASGISQPPKSTSLGAELDVLGVQRGAAEIHPANLDMASGKYLPSRLRTSRR